MTTPAILSSWRNQVNSFFFLFSLKFIWQLRTLACVIKTGTSYFEFHFLLLTPCLGSPWTSIDCYWHFYHYASFTLRPMQSTQKEINNSDDGAIDIKEELALNRVPMSSSFNKCGCLWITRLHERPDKIYKQLSTF